MQNSIFQVFAGVQSRPKNHFEKLLKRTKECKQLTPFFLKKRPKFSSGDSCVWSSLSRKTIDWFGYHAYGFSKYWNQSLNNNLEGAKEFIVCLSEDRGIQNAHIKTPNFFQV